MMIRYPGSQRKAGEDSVHKRAVGSSDQRIITRPTFGLNIYKMLIRGTFKVSFFITHNMIEV